MQERSHGAMALAFSSVLIGLYCQFAALALIVTGSVFSPSGSVHVAATFVIGAAFLGLTFAAYFLAYGLWTRKSWSWAGGVAFLIAFALANVVLSVLSTNFLSSALPLLGGVAGIWYLNRPSIKAELLGLDAAEASPVATHEALGGAQPVR
jgi:hypothetical protein